MNSKDYSATPLVATFDPDLPDIKIECHPDYSENSPQTTHCKSDGTFADTVLCSRNS